MYQLQYMQENFFLEKQDKTKNTMFEKQNLRKILTQKKRKILSKSPCSLKSKNAVL